VLLAAKAVCWRTALHGGALWRGRIPSGGGQGLLLLVGGRGAAPPPRAAEHTGGGPRPVLIGADEAGPFGGAAAASYSTLLAGWQRITFHSLG
jgi:hypothetical protein